MSAADKIKLREWLNRRRQSLEKARSPHEAKWKDIRDHFCPSLGRSLDGDIDAAQRSGSRDDEKIFNSETRILHDKLAAGLQSGITNQARQWFKFAPKNRDILDASEVRAYMGQITDFLHARMNASNLYPALNQIYLRLAAFGQSAALLVPDEGSCFRLVVVDEGAYWIAENLCGRVDTLMRRLRYTVAQMAEDFGHANLPQRIRERLDKGELEAEETVWNLVFPVAVCPKRIHDIPAGREFASVYWVAPSDENGGIVAVRSFDYNPIIAPRWEIGGLTCYGTGPGEKGLGDAKELQSLELASLRQVETDSNPPVAAPSSMKGVPIDTGPGGVTYYDPLPTGGREIPVARLFDTRQSIEGVEAKIQAVTMRLNRIFYVDLFAMLLNLEQRGQARTATEVNELAQEKVSLLGPILTRLNNDLLTPLVEGAWHIAYARAKRDAKDNGFDATGILDAPQALIDSSEPEPDGSVDALAIEYTSTLHAEQQATARLAGPYRFIEFYGGVQNVMQNPELADNIDADKMLRSAAEILDSTGFVRDEQDVEKIRQGRAQAQQAQMQAQMQLQQAQAQAQQAQSVRDLSDARLTDGTSALDIISEAQGVA